MNKHPRQNELGHVRDAAADPNLKYWVQVLKEGPLDADGNKGLEDDIFNLASQLYGVEPLDRFLLFALIRNGLPERGE